PDPHDDAVHAVRVAPARAGHRRGQRAAAPARARRHRRAHAVDADHTVRGADPARGDPGAGVRASSCVSTHAKAWARRLAVLKHNTNQPRVYASALCLAEPTLQGGDGERESFTPPAES